jgi:hypothetical protein
MFEAIEQAIAEVQQPRSRFQLERFVLGQHATPEMRYYQTVLSNFKTQSTNTSLLS